MTCSYCNAEAGHAPGCFMHDTNRPIGNVPAGNVRVSERNHEAETAVWRERVRQLEAIVLEKVAENERLLDACEAAMDAFDGIYGGNAFEETLPIETMTADRQAACHKALELVAAALHAATPKEKRRPSLAALGKLLAREERE